MVDVSSEIEIDAPVGVVGAFAAEPTNAPRWYINIKSVEWQTPPPVALGTRVAFVARFLGRRLAYTYEVTEFVPGRRLVMRTAQGPFPMETTYTWEALADGRTRMRLRNRGQPEGFSRLAGPFVELAMGRANRNDLVRLKDLIERGTTSP